jgi:NADPH:quinone reductase-like Zn-dependent oxidoreductase
MRAIVYYKYGSPDVLEYVELEKPTPGDDEVLVRVRAASINAADRHLITGKPYLLRLVTGLSQRKMKRVGVDLAGEVEAVGPNVTQFKPGDRVFGACRGSFAEYVCALQTRLAPAPADKTFEDAAAVPVAGITALQGLRDIGRIQRGHKVLVDGASGGVGLFAVQIAKSFGAEVTAVCSTRNMEIARSIGADHVIDYTREDFTRGGQRYDLIIGANAYHSIFDYRRALTRDGVFVPIGGGWRLIFEVMILAPLLSLIGSKKTRFFSPKIHQADLVVLKGLLESGQVKSVIEKRYSFSDAADAFRHLEAEHARGKVVITFESDQIK